MYWVAWKAENGRDECLVAKFDVVKRIPESVGQFDQYISYYKESISGNRYNTYDSSTGWKNRKYGSGVGREQIGVTTSQEQGIENEWRRLDRINCKNTWIKERVS